MSIKHLKKIANKLNILDISNEILDDKRFSEWSGSGHLGCHHYGTGGLLIHVTEVIDLCLQTNKYFKKIDGGVNERDLFLAALYHDVGKMWDYELKDNVWSNTEHKSNIHHISRSALVWNQMALKYNFQQERIDNILHAILAHHGLKDWGSPVTPNSKLACILHLCDGLSARYNDIETRAKR